MSEAFNIYRDLFEHYPDSILFIEGDEFVDCNEATVRTLGFRNREELNEKFADEQGILRAHPSHFSPPQQPDGQDSFKKANEMIAMAFRNGTHRFEWEHQRINGEVFPVEVLLIADGQAEPPRLAVIWKEIGELRQLQEKLMHAQRMETLGRFVGGVAHDFNNLLLVITGQMELLRTESTDRAVHRRIQQMMEATDRATAMTQELLAVGRSKSMPEEVVDLRAVTKRLLALVRRMIGEDVAVSSDLGAAPLPVKVDFGRLERSILNLAKNASDAMPEGGAIELRLEQREIRHGDRQFQVAPGKYAVLSFGDNGCGMSLEDQRHCFEPFFTTKEEGTGTGLGLASLNGFVEQSGGGVHLHSEVGAGTCLSFCLPVASGPLSEHAGKQRTSRFVGGSETILLVEDEPAIRAMVAESLQHQGYSVLVAEDGLDALEQVEAFDGAIDLLLTDVVMPRLGGMQLARQLHADFPALRVILTSGYVHGGIGELSEFGQNVIAIAKPYTPGEILAGVREMLDRDSSTPS
jgi:hypothetical protein